jgi:hypothetical protein
VSDLYITEMYSRSGMEEKLKEAQDYRFRKALETNPSVDKVYSASGGIWLLCRVLDDPHVEQNLEVVKIRISRE